MKFRPRRKATPIFFLWRIGQVLEAEDSPAVMANYARRGDGFAAVQNFPSPPSWIAEMVVELALLPALRRGLGR